jgi:hypothetical protein
VDRLQSAGIPVTGCFVVGFDEDGPELFARTFDAIRALELCEVQVTVLTPFPGTELFDRLRREGRLDRLPFWDRLTLFDLVFEPARMRRSELMSGFRELIAALHSPAELERRARRRRACYRQSARRRRAPRS